MFKTKGRTNIKYWQNQRHKHAANPWLNEHQEQQKGQNLASSMQFIGVDIKKEGFQFRNVKRSFQGIILLNFDHIFDETN